MEFSVSSTGDTPPTEREERVLYAAWNEAMAPEPESKVVDDRLLASKSSALEPIELGCSLRARDTAGHMYIGLYPRTHAPIFIVWAREPPNEVR